MRFCQKAKIRIGTVDCAQRELHQADLVQQKDQDESFADRRRRIEFGFARNREHVAEAVTQDILDGFGLAQARNAGPGLGHQVRDARIVGVKKDQMPGDPAGVEFVELMPAVSCAGDDFVPGHLSLRQ